LSNRQKMVATLIDPHDDLYLDG